MLLTELMLFFFIGDVCEEIRKVIDCVKRTTSLDPLGLSGSNSSVSFGANINAKTSTFSRLGIPIFKLKLVVSFLIISIINYFTYI